jgi:hypothetical protein
VTGVRVPFTAGEPMGGQWYVARNDQRFGPLSFEELTVRASSGKLLPSDLVWSDGMTEWKAASQVQGLFASMPPPLPKKPAVMDRFQQWGRSHVVEAATETRKNFEALGTAAGQLGLGTAAGAVKSFLTSRGSASNVQGTPPTGQPVHPSSAPASPPSVVTVTACRVALGMHNAAVSNDESFWATHLEHIETCLLCRAELENLRTSTACSVMPD